MSEEKFVVAFPNSKWLSSHDFHKMWKLHENARPDLSWPDNLCWQLGCFALSVVEKVGQSVSAAKDQEIQRLRDLCIKNRINPDEQHYDKVW